VLKLQTNVFKFGGSCFKTEQSFNQSLKIVEKYHNEPLAIVCSALYGVTDKLIEYGNSVVNPGDIEDAPDIFLSEIKDKHMKFIDTLIQDDDLHKEMETFIQEKIDDLMDLRNHIEQEGLTPENHDYLVSFGERISGFLYTEYLKSEGFQAQFIPSDEDFLITDSNFGNALPKLNVCKKNIIKKLNPNLEEKKISIIPGFYGKNKKGQVTTLGRGGSDFTATIVGWALSEEDNFVNCIFWKDVNGILTVDPQYVKNPKLLKKISIKEAKELTFFGTKILHPKCLNTAEKGGDHIKIEIRNFNDPFSEEFTTITKKAFHPDRSDKIIKAITTLNDIAMITVQSDAMVDLPGTAAKIFSIIAEYNINIIFITQGSSENNISFGVYAQDGLKAKKLLEKNKYFGSNWFKVKIEMEAALLSVVGAQMVHKPGVAGLLFTTLGNAGINIRAISQGSSEMNITMVISRDSLERAIKVCYSSFIEGNLPTKIAKW